MNRRQKKKRLAKAWTNLLRLLKESHQRLPMHEFGPSEDILLNKINKFSGEKYNGFVVCKVPK